jgi:hypothetical protein
MRTQPFILRKDWVTMSDLPIKISADAKDIKDLWKFIYYKWSSIKGVICSIVILNLCLCIFHIIKSWNLWLISFLPLNILLLILWFILFYIPRTPRNKIGFFIAINCETSENAGAFRTDFIDSIRKCLDLGNNGVQFYFKILPDYISAKILRTEDAKILTLKYRANFLLYGRVRTRVISNQTISVIDINGIVTHSPISHDIHTKFTKEFGELLPQRIFVDKENDLLKYEFTAQCVDLISKYIIGISFFLSGLNERALMLYHEINSLLRVQQPTLPAINKIRNRMQTRFFEVYSQLANKEYNLWLNNEGIYPLDKYKSIVSTMSELCPDVGPAHLYKAILCFLDSRDIKGARVELSKCKNVNEAILLCDHAFLEGYGGNLSSARARYKKAAKLNVPISTINQIEDFISIILILEPEKYQLYYCLAWINWCIKGDIEQGKLDFEEFIKKDSNHRYENEIRLSREYIKQLK